MSSLLRNPDLESVILDDPLDPDAWLVYGDWLESQGDPRGELVAVQARLARNPGEPALMAAQRQLFARHGDMLLEGLHDYLQPGVNEDGSRHGPLLRISWEFGFIWTAAITRDGHSPATYARGLAALLAHPSATFLHACSFTTAVSKGSAPAKNDWQSVVGLIAETPRPFQILFLGDAGPQPGFAPLGDVSALWPALPRLRCLGLRGGVMTVGALDLPSLREITIETGALTRETLLEIGRRSWPGLEKLEVWFGDRRCTATLPDLGFLFDEGAPTKMPKLRHLGLRNCSFVDRVCASLGRAPITKQLHVLDLSLGALTERGMNELVSARAAFEHLAVLDLHHHYIPSGRLQAADVSTLARFVDVSGALYEVVEEGGDDGDEENRRRFGRVWLDG